jgi:tetratricopeptide (TPR) repeat protein
MRKDRWRSLDWEPPTRKTAEEAGAAVPPEPGNGTSRKTRHGALGGLGLSRHPAVAAARGFYLLKNWQAVVDALSAETLEEPTADGAWLLRGLALAHLGELDAAKPALDRAIHLAPEDAFTGCVQAAFLLYRGWDVEAWRTLEAGVQGPGTRGAGGGVQALRRSGVQYDPGIADPPLDASEPPLNARTPERLNAHHPLTWVAEQLRAACEWAEGQRQLQQGAATEAARRFAAAGERFIAAAEALAVARQALPERLGAVYVGQVTSLLAAGRLESALQLYGRLRPAGIRFAPPLERFARDLHELCRLLPHAPPEQEPVDHRSLTALVTDTRMLVDLWDGGQPVTITWRGGWGR